MNKMVQRNQGLIKTLAFLLCSAALFPLFSLIIKGWVSGILFFSTLIAILLFILYLNQKFSNKDRKTKLFFEEDRLSQLAILFVLAFCLPFLSVLLGQLLQGMWNISRFDAPSRYLLAIIVFFAIVFFGSGLRQVLEFSIPAASIITYLLIPYVPVTVWSSYPDRLTNHFIDPLIFGQVSLALGVMSILMISPSEKRPWFITLFKLIGGLAGIYLSLRSGSRTGWLAVPLIIFLWVVHYSPFSRWKTVLFAILITSSVVTGMYFGSNTIKSRMYDMRFEIEAYQWNAMNPDTSIAHRISWMRIGLHYFLMRPLSGWGNDSLTNNINDENISVFSSKASRDELLAVGFHNDFIANAVRYGVGGLLATIAIFFIPLIFFAYCLRYHKQVESFAMIGLAYVLIQSVSSLSYHVLDFKFMASFYALMVSVLIGVIINKVRQ
jgi:O-antigen ligase